jgi:hypothetical protein
MMTRFSSSPIHSHRGEAVVYARVWTKVSFPEDWDGAPFPYLVQRIEIREE